MTRYEVLKYEDDAVVANYGYFSNIEDVKAITKGYKLDEDGKERFGFLAYVRKRSKYYYIVNIIES